MGQGNIGWVATFIFPLLYVYFFMTGYLAWRWWQYALAIILGADLGGGMVCNALNSCKQFYFTPLKADETGFVRVVKNHLLFSALHIHPIIIWIIFGGSAWLYGLFWYSLYLICVFITLNIPLYLKRPISILLLLFALLINYYFIPPIKGFEWLIPVLFVKIVLGHLVREEPYRPSRPNVESGTHNRTS